MHSDNSATIDISIKRHPRAGVEIMAEGVKNGNTRLAIKDVLKKWSWIGKKIGVFPIIPKLSIKPPGRGYHSGGTFPMRVSPKLCESDLLGRPYSFKRVHLVDSSVFPTIPPGLYYN